MLDLLPALDCERRPVHLLLQENLNTITVKTLTNQPTQLSALSAWKVIVFGFAALRISALDYARAICIGS